MKIGPDRKAIGNFAQNYRRGQGHEADNEHSVGQVEIRARIQTEKKADSEVLKA